MVSQQKKSYRSTSVSGSVRNDTEARIKHEWNNVQVLLQGGQPSQLKQALISADKSFDNALKDVTEGETMGERMKNAKDKFEWDFYQKIWDAHKLRNSIVHEAGFDPSHLIIKEKVEVFKKALNQLGVTL